MKLYWLVLDKPCVLDLPGVTDYAGTRLNFRPKRLTRRCVNEKTYNSDIVQRYLRTGLLKLANTENKPVAAPTPVILLEASDSSERKTVPATPNSKKQEQTELTERIENKEETELSEALEKAIELTEDALTESTEDVVDMPVKRKKRKAKYSE